MVKVELISASGCRKCAKARDELKTTSEQLAGGRVQWRDINVLDDLDYVVSLGVLTLPAIAIDGKLIFASLPTPEQLRAELMKHLRA